jgi:putative MATE family efflux protein
MIVEQALRVLVGTVDTLLVSHLGDAAVAAVGATTQLLNLAVMLFTVIGAGGTVVMTHHLGAGDARGAARAGSVAVTLNTALGIAVSAAVALLARPALQAMQLPAAVAVLASPFLVGMGGTLFLEAHNVAAAAILRAHGRTATVMVAGAVQNVVNAATIGALLFGLLGLPRLGIPGVAIAGVAGRLVAAACLRVALRRAGHRGGLRGLRAATARTLPAILRVGLPVAGENGCWSLAFVVVTGLVARMGAAPLAGLSYALQLSTWVSLVGGGLALANQLRVGRLVGLGALRAARAAPARALRVGLPLVGAAALALALLGPLLLRRFTGDPAVLAAATSALRLALLLEPGRFVSLVAVNALRAAGDARYPLTVAVVSMWSIWVGLAWALGLVLGLGLAGVWLAMATDEWLRSAVNLRRWEALRWVPAARRARRTAREG